MDEAAWPELILPDEVEAVNTEAVVQVAKPHNDDEPARKDDVPGHNDDEPEHCDDALFCGNNISYDP